MVKHKRDRLAIRIRRTHATFQSPPQPDDGTSIRTGRRSEGCDASLLALLTPPAPYPQAHNCHVTRFFLQHMTPKQRDKFTRCDNNRRNSSDVHGLERSTARATACTQPLAPAQGTRAVEDKKLNVKRAIRAGKSGFVQPLAAHILLLTRTRDARDVQAPSPTQTSFGCTANRCALTKRLLRKYTLSVATGDSQQMQRFWYRRKPPLILAIVGDPARKMRSRAFVYGLTSAVRRDKLHDCLVSKRQSRVSANQEK